MPSAYVTNLLAKFDLTYKDVPAIDPSDENFEEEAEKLLQTSLWLDGGAGHGKSYLMKRNKKRLELLKICFPRKSLKK